MKPLIVLISVFLISLIIIKLTSGAFNYKLSGKIAMSAMLIFTAIGHFVFIKGMSMMLPEFIPFKPHVVVASGIFEILIGIALLFPKYEVTTGWILIAFFILILPSNIKAAIDHIDLQSATYNGNGLAYLWFRIPLQVLFIAWVYLSAVRQ